MNVKSIVLIAIILGLALQAVPTQAQKVQAKENDNSIRPFEVKIPKEALIDLR